MGVTELFHDNCTTATKDISFSISKRSVMVEIVKPVRPIHTMDFKFNTNRMRESHVANIVVLKPDDSDSWDAVKNTFIPIVKDHAKLRYLLVNTQDLNNSHYDVCHLQDFA